MNTKTCNPRSSPKQTLAALFVTALWMHSPGASASTEAVPYPVIVLFETAEGRRQQPLLEPLRYDPGDGERLNALQRILNADRAHALSTLAIPTGCGHAQVAVCSNVHITTDVELWGLIRRIGAPEVLIVQPMAGVWVKEQVYHALLKVQLLDIQPRVQLKRSFEVGYKDWQCDPGCVAVSHRYAAEEFREMIEYMLALTLNTRPRRLPPSWSESPKLKSVSRWQTNCGRFAGSSRLVRDDRDRAWLGSAPGVADLWLGSVSWAGCGED